MSATRRELLIGAGVLFAAACSPRVVEPINSSGRFEHSLKYDVNARRVLKYVLNEGIVLQLQEAIKTNFKNPYAQLAELEKASVDRGDFAHYPVRWTASGNYLLPSTVTCTIRGTGGTGGLEASLGKHLSLTTSIEAMPADGDVKSLRFRTNLSNTFGTGLTPDVDKFVDTSRHYARIAEKDLLAASSEVLNLPEGLEWTLSKGGVDKTLSAELALKSPDRHITYYYGIGQNCSVGLSINTRLIDPRT